MIVFEQCLTTLSKCFAIMLLTDWPTLTWVWSSVWRERTDAARTRWWACFFRIKRSSKRPAPGMMSATHAWVWGVWREGGGEACTRYDVGYTCVSFVCLSACLHPARCRLHMRKPSQFLSNLCISLSYFFSIHALVFPISLWNSNWSHKFRLHQQ